MLKRLGLGLLKGLIIGGAIGAGLQYGLRWDEPVGTLLGFLIAMGVAGTTGVFAGRPPWQPGAWIEATLKGMVGVGLGALVYWLASKWGHGPAFAFPGMTEPAQWTQVPVLFAPGVAGVYGALVELDNTGESKKEKDGPKKARVAAEDDLEEEEEVVATSKGKNKRQA